MTVETEVLAPIEIFWQPGCSSCLRMKEFIEKTGVDYVEHNIAVDLPGREKLRASGLGVPAVLRGDVGVPGMDLVAIAKLVGYPYDPPQILEPAVMKAKYDRVIECALVFMSQLPDEGFEYKSPDRDRSMRSLFAHIGTIMRRFLDAYETDEFDNAGAPPDLISETGTREELIAWASEVRELFDAWWDRFGFDDPLDRVLETSWGYRTLHEVLERAVWHTAQHTRQIQYFMQERLEIEPEVWLSEDDLAGLPLPERVHA